MMNCNKCGSELQDGSVFCSKCGNRINDDAVNRSQAIEDIDVQPSQSKNKLMDSFRKILFFRSKKSTIISVTILIVLAAVMIFTIPNYLSLNDARNFKAAFASRKYEQAGEIYQKASEYSQTDRWKPVRTYIDKYFKNDIEAIKNKFTNEKITKDESIKILDEMGQYSTINEISQTKEYILKLSDSRDAFKSGEEYFSNHQYLEAVENFKKVINDDNNFTQAQNYLEKSFPELKSQVINEADQCFSNGEYKKSFDLMNRATKLLPDDNEIKQKATYYQEQEDKIEKEAEEKKISQLQENQLVKVLNAWVEEHGVPSGFVKVKNYSDKVIKKYTVGMLMYDKNGYPVNKYLRSTNEMVATADKNVQPNETKGDDFYWLLEYDVSKIKACIKEVEFYDGSTWQNEYYDTWLEKEKDRY